ncbi:DUF4384 domain-containing protein [Maridesulfovibrio bastinii]|uniref:DUF4384 domain-containing protein n=1 Tax=Maridesulfovibrio bastinii TaxID=47157 RepID=UPI00040BCDE2|nr:DUF4384 domain-containing protein [Maridesulfovibrio bastinii]
MLSSPVLYTFARPISALFCLVLLILSLIFTLPQTLYADGKKQISKNSIIVESEGMACLGQDRTRTQTQKLALDTAKRKASEKVSTYVSIKTEVVKGKLHQDVVDVFSKATIKVLDEIEKGWVKSSEQSEYVDSCYRIKIKAEVIPSEHKFQEKSIGQIDNPRAPLNIQLWTNKDTYNLGDTLKFYFKGNKPFYARAIYKDSNDNLIEVTQHNNNRYYRGGVIHEIPGNKDNFTLMVTPPFGKEKLILYASTKPINGYQGQSAGNLYVVKNNPRKIGMETRGLAVLAGNSDVNSAGGAEFAEVDVEVQVIN